MATPDYKIRLTADPSGVRAGVKQAEASLKSLSSELGNIKSLAAGALSFAGVGLGAAELIRVADAYGQVTARLQLATKSTGDFAEVQALLRQAAEDTRAPLGETVDLYSKLAPALQGLGRNSAQSVGVITTINQAIALSGASAEASQAALIQFGQALASGALRGDELNSIMEQTPGLARAIAEGLGVNIGKLREMGAAGELTADRIVTALERVSGRVGDDFAELPLTVGQSLTLLQNSFTELVGSFDQSAGVTRALGEGIAYVAENLDTVAKVAIPLTVAAIVPMIARLGILAATATKAAVAMALVNPVGAIAGIAAATAAYIALDQVLGSIGEKDGSGSAEEQAKQQQNLAEARLKVEQDLAKETLRLAKLRAVEEGRASAAILGDTKEAIKRGAEEKRKAQQEELKGAQALRDALRSAWQEAVNGATKARLEAAALLQQAADARQSGIDRATDRRMRGMSDEERSDYAERQASDLRDQASSSAARSIIKAYEGDLKAAEKLAEQAAKQAEKAERYADQITDDDTAANLFEELGRIREQALSAQAKTKEAEAQNLTEIAEQQNSLIAEQEAKIQALKAELAKPVTIAADIKQAEESIRNLQAQLDQIKDKTVTVTVNTVSTAPADTSGMTREQLIDAIPGFATGGFTGHGAKYQPAGVVHAGEFVLRQEVVRQAGMLAFLEHLNRTGRLPGYASGGMVTPRVSSAATSSATPVVLDLGTLGRYSTSAESEVADQLVRVFQRAALQRGRRK